MAKRSKDGRQTPGERSSARMKQYIYIAIGLCAFAVLIPSFLNLYDLFQTPTYREYLNPTSQELHSIFFSGEPHLIFCTNRTGLDVPRLIRRVSDHAVETTHNGTTRVEGEDSVKEEEEVEYSVEKLEMTIDEREKAYKDGVISSPVHPIHVGTMDCSAPLPSGLSVLDRFKLTLPPVIKPGQVMSSNGGMTGNGVVQTLTPHQLQLLQPLPPAFFIANGERPQWVPNSVFMHQQQSGAQSYEPQDDSDITPAIVQHVRARAAPRTMVIESEKFLTSRCLSKKSCLLVLHSGTSNLLTSTTSTSIRAVQKKYPAISIGTIDVKKYTLSLQKQLGKLENSDQNKWPRMLYFRRVVQKDDKQEDKSTTTKKNVNNKSSAAKPSSTLYVKSYKGRWSPRDVLKFVDSLTDLPTFDTNTTNSNEKPKTSQMAVLKSPPLLNYGPNNFKKPPKANASKKAPTKSSTSSNANANSNPNPNSNSKNGPTSSTPTASEKKSEAERLEREREAKRRAQMEEEAADNFVMEASEDGDLVAGETEVEEDEEEVLTLDDDNDL